MAEFFIDILGVDKGLNDKSLNGEILNDDEKSYPLDEVPVIQRARAGFAKLPKQEQERIRAKVRAQMGLK